MRTLHYTDNGGIYKITCLNNNRIYIGSSSSAITRRWYQHISTLNKNEHDNNKLQNDWKEYGYKNFIFQILEFKKFKNDKERFELEQYYINIYRDSYELYNKYESCSNISQFYSNVECVGDIDSMCMLSYNERVKRFINYINNRWLLPIGILDNFKYRIWTNEDKNEIIEMAIKCKLYPLVKSKISFNRIMSTLNDCFGYEIESGRHRVNKKQYMYKLIVNFDEEKIDFEKPYETVNE